MSLGGAIDLANLESRLKPEGGLQQQSADGNESGSDEDHRMTFVGGRRQTKAAGQGLSEEPQVDKLLSSISPTHEPHWRIRWIVVGLSTNQPYLMIDCGLTLQD